MSLVLRQCPVLGTDGAPGARTYFAHPMAFFRAEAHLLRDLGECLAPDNYAPGLLKSIIGERSELYKLEVRVPADPAGGSWLRRDHYDK